MRLGEALIVVPLLSLILLFSGCAFTYNSANLVGVFGNNMTFSYMQYSIQQVDKVFFFRATNAGSGGNVSYNLPDITAWIVANATEEQKKVEGEI